MITLCHSAGVTSAQNMTLLQPALSFAHMCFILSPNVKPV